MKRFAIIPLLLLGLLSGGFRGLGNTTACSFTVPNAGAVTANSLAGCLSNPTDLVRSLSNWSTAANYLMANDRNQYVFKSTATYRDVEVSLWAREGYTYLRLDSNGTAIYFFHEGETTNGQLDIGIVTGLNETAYPSGTYYPLYSNVNLVGTIGTSGTVCTCGYTKAATQGQYFTFGVSGFDIYVKYDGVEFARFKDWRQMNYGAVAVKSNATGQYGFRNADGNAGHITITPTYPPALYSRYSIGELDMRDWGLRNVAATTGNITSGSNSLTVANASNFKVGDFIIVEIGTEAGAGLRGTVGVGGTWPSQSYANQAALPGSAADLTYAWVQDTAQVYVYQVSPAGWTTFQTENYGGQGTLNNPNPFYYPTLAVPRSLHAKISAINGNVLTLVQLDGTTAANASATATGANVYLDNQQPFNNLLQAPRTTLTALDRPQTLVVPAGTYALGGVLKGQDHANWAIKGAGKTSTIFNSAKGMRPAGTTFQNMSGMKISDLAMNGNYGNNYFGLDFFDTLTPQPTSTKISQYDAAGNIVWVQQTGGVSDTLFLVGWFPSGITLTSSDNALVQDVNLSNMFHNAIDFEDTTNGQGVRVAYTQVDPVQIYVQWLFEWATSTNGGCTDCSINCGIYVCSGPEMFNSIGVAWNRFTSVNAAFSINNAKNFDVENSSITFTLNSKSPFWTSSEFMFSIDTSTGGDLAGAGVINGLTMVTDFNDGASKDIPPGIQISSPLYTNVTISNVTYTAPNWVTPGQTPGPKVIQSNGTNTQISNITSCGTIDPALPVTFTRSALALNDGAITNSTLPSGKLFLGSGATSSNISVCP